MTLEDIIKQRLAEATKEAQADLVTEAKVKLKKAETVDADDKSAEVDTTPKLKKDDKKIVKESVFGDNKENKEWNSNGHKELSDNYGYKANEQIKDHGTDGNKDHYSAYSVKIDKPLTIKNATLHNHFHQNDSIGDVEERDEMHKAHSHSAKPAPKEMTLPKDHHIVIDHGVDYGVEKSYIYGHHPDHGYFRASYKDHKDQLKSAKKVYDGNFGDLKESYNKEDTVSSQVSALLEAEGLSEASVQPSLGKFNVVHNGKVVQTYVAKYEAEDHAKEINHKAKSEKTNKKPVKESVSSQVSALLEAEGLSEDFKLQAVTIFEAAVTDRVLQIEEELKQEFETQIAEAKAELNKDIDGFLSEAILQWKQENEVAIKTNFNTQVAESFMDGMRALIAEHNIEVPEGKEDALEVALSEVEKLNEAATAKDAEFAELQEQVNTLKAAQILESFKAKMTQTEFDRFTQLTESVQFTDAEQYEKQLSIVLENFGAKKVVEAVKTVAQEVITEQVQSAVQVITESDSNVAKYATFIAKKRI